MQQEHIGNNEKWAVYESNVQTYRSNFISSQSFFLAVGAIMLGKSPLWMIVALALIAAVNIWYIWFRIILARIRIVDFHKFNMGKRFALAADASGKKDVILTDGTAGGEFIPIREKDYVTSSEIRGKINSLMTQNQELRALWSDSFSNARFRNMRMTRMKIDVLIPILFSLVWLLFVGYSLMETIR